PPAPVPLAPLCQHAQPQPQQPSHLPTHTQLTLPGPIMTSFPQNTAVGSTSSAAVGSELSAQGQPISGGFG
ncbi:KRFA protein, partial [Aegithalos caudatus]|nr:KRFA protein [Aegithalos caudatus]